MLEDIRDHSPMPRQQEIEWMAARPFRAVIHVLVLATIALGAGVAIEELQQPGARPTVAQATAPLP